MESEADAYLHLHWVIYNDKIGIHDYVQINRIEMQNGLKVAYLDSPYDMVGPFCFETLLKEESIKFAACTVMTQSLWRSKAHEFQEEMLLRAKMREEAFTREAKRYSERKHNVQEHYFRQCLELPLEEKINLKIIKSAYKEAAKKSHPDYGGSHEAFCELQEAYEGLILIYQTA